MSDANNNKNNAMPSNHADPAASAGHAGGKLWWFVLALLLWVIVRYNRRANPTPKKFTHNMLVEVIWTVVPVLILVVIVMSALLMHSE